MRVKTEIELSALLNWVYSRQNAHIILGTGRGLYEQERNADGVFVPSVSGDGCYQIARLAEVGTKVDGGGYSADDIHPDAEAVHLAVKSLGMPWVRILIEYGMTNQVPDLTDAVMAQGQLSGPKSKRMEKLK